MRMEATPVTLAIGGIAILLTGERDFVVNGPYRAFISKEQPEVCVHARFGAVPSLEPEMRVFQSGGNWNLLRVGKQWAIQVRSPASNRFQRVALFDRDFLEGEILAETPEVGQAVLFPLEYPLDEVLMINLLARGRGVLLHACGVSYQGRGFVFTGTSGAGKSTLAGLWARHSDAEILSDDRVIVRRHGGRFWVYGTPWHGDALAASPTAVPLERIYIIQHASENRVVPLGPASVTSALLVRSFPTFWDARGMAFTLEFLAGLAQQVECCELGFVPDPSVVEYVSRTA